jgi:SAM-dependent methyltransferase
MTRWTGNAFVLGVVAMTLVACKGGDDGPCEEGAAGCRCQRIDGSLHCDEGLTCVEGLCFGDGVPVPDEYLYTERAKGDETQINGILKEKINLAPGMIVADIGAGHGFFATHAARRIHPGGRLYATDIDPSALEALRASIEDASDRDALEATIVQRLVKEPGDTALEDLPDGSVDLVTMFRVFTFQVNAHEENVDFMRRVVRILRPGGRLVYHMDYVNIEGYGEYLTRLMAEVGLTGAVTEIPMPAHIPHELRRHDWNAKSVREPMITMYRGLIVVFRTPE